MKKTEQLKNKICKVTQELNPTITSLCRKFGISTRTFYYWHRKDEDFRNAYDKAVRVYIDNLNIDAKKSLAKLVKGFTVVDTKTVYGPGQGDEPVIIQMIEMKREIPPSVEAVKFALTNVDPDNFEK